MLTHEVEEICDESFKRAWQRNDKVLLGMLQIDETQHMPQLE